MQSGKKVIDLLKTKLRACAAADAILSPAWEFRYFSYDCNWGPGEETASLRNGEGGAWFVLFFGDRIGYKCISPGDGLIDTLAEIKAAIPKEFQSFLAEPAFYENEASRIMLFDNGEWMEYGLDKIKNMLDLETIGNWKAEDYRAWAREYYEREIELEPLQAVFDLRISDAVVKKLNPECSLKKLAKDLAGIGIDFPGKFSDVKA
jgi:hypothetical protein